MILPAQHGLVLDLGGLGEGRGRWVTQTGQGAFCQIAGLAAVLTSRAMHIQINDRGVPRHGWLWHG